MSAPNPYLFHCPQHRVVAPTPVTHCPRCGARLNKTHVAKFSPPLQGLVQAQRQRHKQAQTVRHNARRRARLAAAKEL